MASRKIADDREEPDAGGENFKVDRVFAPSNKVGVVRGRRQTLRPGSEEAADTEFALRLQLSRLQRQLADTQQQLADKDEQLATELERRRALVAVSDAFRQAHDELEETVAQAHEYRARTEGLEQRLQDALATASELTHQLDRERGERQTLATQLEEHSLAFERARALWRDESTLNTEHHAGELAHATAQRRAAVEAIEAKMAAALERQKEAHDAELADLKAAHERSLAALRGDLEPKVAEARNLSEELERLDCELKAAKAEHLRDVTERAELHKWELQLTQEAHTATLATAIRHHETELAKYDEKLASKAAALAQAERNGVLREQLWERTVDGLRDSQKALQQELAKAREDIVQAEASKAATENRLEIALSELDRHAEELLLLQDQLDATGARARQRELDRQRLVAYLEEGLAMLGALAPTAPRGER